jgi:hypothetical protein
LKKSFYHNIVDQYNKKMEVMKCHTSIIKRNIHAPPSPNTDGKTGAGGKGKGGKGGLTDKGDKEGKTAMSEFESVLRNLDSGFSWMVENGTFRPDSREGHTMVLVVIIFFCRGKFLDFWREKSRCIARRPEWVYLS